MIQYIIIAIIGLAVAIYTARAIVQLFAPPKNETGSCGGCKGCNLRKP